jgi:phage-related protein
VTERGLIWVGDCRKTLLGFPKAARTQIGYALSEAQQGRRASYAKPVSGLGPGVLEIIADHNTDTYRAVYALKLGERLYVLHAFKKKSKSGIATPKSEIDLVRRRIKLVRAQLQEKT